MLFEGEKEKEKAAEKVSELAGMTPASLEFRGIWRKALGYKDGAIEAEVGLRTEEFHAGFRFKIEKMLTPRLMVSHALEMGGHHPKEEGAMALMRASAPPSSDPSSYEFAVRYALSPGNMLSGNVRSDGFSMVGADLRLASWFDLHLAGQFVRDNAASFVIADFRGAASSLILKMIQQTNFEANFSQHIGDRLVFGSQLQYDAASFWSNSSVMMRILSRLSPHTPAGVVLPKEVITIEAGTLSAKDQALAVPKGDEEWSKLQSMGKQIGFVSASWWTTVADNYRLSAAAKMQRESKWKTSVKFGMEYVTQLATYKGVIDPFNLEIASEVREEVQPGVVWQMCSKVNYIDQTYRFGAGLTFQF